MSLNPCRCVRETRADLRSHLLLSLSPFRIRLTLPFAVFNNHVFHPLKNNIIIILTIDFRERIWSFNLYWSYVRLRAYVNDSMTFSMDRNRRKKNEIRKPKLSSEHACSRKVFGSEFECSVSSARRRERTSNDSSTSSRPRVRVIPLPWTSEWTCRTRSSKFPDEVVLLILLLWFHSSLMRSFETRLVAGSTWCK